MLDGNDELFVESVNVGLGEGRVGCACARRQGNAYERDEDDDCWRMPETALSILRSSRYFNKS